MECPSVAIPKGEVPPINREINIDIHWAQHKQNQVKTHSLTHFPSIAVFFPHNFSRCLCLRVGKKGDKKNTLKDISGEGGEISEIKNNNNN
jgi:hypothetical protein